MKKHLLLIAGLLSSITLAQTYDNGGLSTGATANNGTAAPAGFTWSETQNNTGNTTESNTNAGYGGTSSSATASFFLADDFVVPPGKKWQISTIDFFAYQTGYTGSTNPFTTVRVNIFSSDPSVAGATSVFGDDTTNRYASGTSAKMYRIFNSTIPTASAPGTTRQIWKITANTSVTLNPGTYWIKYQLQNVVMTNAGFLPAVTIPGTRGLPTFNGKQYDAIASTWTDLIDAGNPATAPDYPMDMPFVITYVEQSLGTAESVQYDNRVRIYPNPVEDSFKISLPSGSKAESIEIMDASGKLIKVMKVQDEYRVSDLQKGTYYLKIKGDTLPKVTTFIKK